ncbi:MAG: OmpA family protein [Cellvibrionaceae bacterium]|nr:OmpA family protein [Cellvibrionaceae bacterium]
MDGSGFSPAFGIGVAVPFAERFSARLEYQYFGKVGDSELGRTQPTLLSLGLTWHFASDRAFESSAPPAAIFTPENTPQNHEPVAQIPVNAEADTSATQMDSSAPALMSNDGESDAADTEADVAASPELVPEPSSADLMNGENTGETMVEADVALPEESAMVEQGAIVEQGVTDAGATSSVVIDDHSNSPLFAKGSSVLKINYALEKIAVDLLRRPNLFVHIEVHTDDQGSREENQQLSTARAIKLADYLKWQGVSSERITVEGKGKSQPLADDNIEVGRARSRRAEFFISETRTQR